MSFLLGAIGVVICIGLALTGYLVPMLIGGFIGSFFGVAGFGFLKALNLVNPLNAGLFGLLYLGIFIQLRGWR